MSFVKQLEEFRNATKEYLKTSQMLVFAIEFSDETLPTGNYANYRASLFRVVLSSHPLPAAPVLLTAIAELDSCVMGLWADLEDDVSTKFHETADIFVRLPRLQSHLSALAGVELTEESPPIGISPAPDDWSGFHAPGQLQKLAKNGDEISATTWRRRRNAFSKHVRPHESSGDKQVQITRWFAKLLKIQLPEFSH